jgi:hypothetical protein
MISVVRIATGYELGDRGVGVRVPVVSTIFCSPRRADRFWGPMVTGGSFSEGKTAGA